MNGNGDRPVTRAELREELERFDRRFEEIDGRFEKIDGRFEEIDGRFEKIDGRFEKIDGRFDSMARTINYVVEVLGGKIDELRAEMSRNNDELRAEMSRNNDELRAEMSRNNDELRAEIARAARANAEETRQFIGVLDDRYRDLPARVGVLERDLDEHRRDTALHRQPPRRPPRK